MTAFSFFTLAAYLVIDRARSLTRAEESQHSPTGFTLAALSLLVMPFLSLTQRRAGHRVGSPSAVADSKQQTVLRTYLSAVLLTGLLANSLLGWSWADPVAGLVTAAIAVCERINAWRGKTYCAVPGLTGPVMRAAAGVKFRSWSSAVVPERI